MTLWCNLQILMWFITAHFSLMPELLYITCNFISWSITTLSCGGLPLSWRLPTFLPFVSLGGWLITVPFPLGRVCQRARAKEIIVLPAQSQKMALCLCYVTEHNTPTCPRVKRPFVFIIEKWLCLYCLGNTKCPFTLYSNQPFLMLTYKTYATMQNVQNGIK